MQRILTKLDQINVTKLDDVASAPLETGQIRLALQSFALTANNVTYAATGPQIGYWKFFPVAQDGQGIVPVWGTAEVVETTAPDIEIGTRFYGFYPMAQELVITPRLSKSGTLEDTAPHRAGLPAVYNRYVPIMDSDAHTDHLRALLQPLLATSWLLSDWLADNAFFGASQVIVGSASSKTGLGLCAYLAADRACSVVGLTSAKNKAFVDALGTCDQVLTYDAVDTLAQVPSVYVDMAGNAAVKQTLHATLGAHLKHSAAVGISHWDKFAPPKDLPGVKPQFFFAPAQIAKRRDDWGPGVVEQKINAAWQRVAQDSDAWLDVTLHTGLDSARDVYDQLARGASDPRAGHVVQIPT